jgi:hypothetical protein
MELLPNELLALILIKLDRCSLSAIILTNKLLNGKANDQELLNTMYPQTKIPLSRILLLHDYKQVEPQKYIHVVILNEYFEIKFDKLFFNTIGLMLYEDIFELTIQVLIGDISELIVCICIRDNFAKFCYVSTVSKRNKSLGIVMVGGREYEIKNITNIVEIMNEIYQNKQYKVISAKVHPLEGW